MENMYIYQPTTANMQNQQEQKEKEMPNFHCMLETKESFLDVLARQVMVYDCIDDTAAPAHDLFIQVVAVFRHERKEFFGISGRFFLAYRTSEIYIGEIVSCQLQIADMWNFNVHSYFVPFSGVAPVFCCSAFMRSIRLFQ